MTCNDCIHDGVCYLQEITVDIDEQLREFGCEDFKNKADFVEVVRCKDCSKFSADVIANGIGWCDDCESGKCDNDFCSYGERKDTQ